LATSTIKVNGAIGTTFNLSRSIFLFLLLIFYGHVLNNPRYGVNCLTLPKDKIMEDQTFIDDIARISKQFGGGKVFSCFFLISLDAKIN
jgi:hypothetical protein